MIIELDETYLDAILAIENNSFAIPWSREMFESELEQSFSRTWGWVEESRLFGYLVGWLMFEEFHVANLAVIPEARGRGIGTKLLAHALAWAISEGAERSLLEVRESNVPARRLYESAGYSVVAVRSAYYEHPLEDALILARNL
jgi:ribosomal-protein-alanine N-acetyltransferase